MFSRNVVLAAALLASAEAFAPALNKAPTSTALNAVGIYYSTSTGNTEACAEALQEASGIEPTEISDAEDDAVAGADGLIFGAPTWNTGADDYRSGTALDDWLYDNLPNIDLKDKPVAIFGCGDQASYGDNYCDSAGELYDLFTAAGAKVFGMTSQEGYDHVESKAVRDDKFVGMMFDQDNQDDMTEDRAAAWVAQLKEEGFPL